MFFTYNLGSDDHESIKKRKWPFAIQASVKTIAVNCRYRCLSSLQQKLWSLLIPVFSFRLEARLVIFHLQLTHFHFSVYPLTQQMWWWEAILNMVHYLLFSLLWKNIWKTQLTAGSRYSQTQWKVLESGKLGLQSHCTQSQETKRWMLFSPLYSDKNWGHSL